MQHDILKHAILDFRRFHALKATPNRPVEFVGLGTPGILTVVCGVGHSNNSHGILTVVCRDSHGSLWGWVGIPGILTVVCGVGHSHGSLWGCALQGFSR